MEVRLFTLDDANALIGELEDLMVEARRLTDRVREAEAHLEDLRIVWGEQLHGDSCPAKPEYEARLGDVKARRLALEIHLQRFHELGVELKGVDLGLVDFPSLNGDQLVYLCWREGEKEITSWHTIEGGFAGRRPIPDFVREGEST